MHTLLRTITKWLLSLYYDVTVIGRENIPVDEPIIATSGHQAVVDSYALPAFLERNLVFLSKEEYFTLPGLKGWLMRTLLTGRAVPVNRASAISGVRALRELKAVLDRGGDVGLHPEGTRVPEGLVCKGLPGAVSLAWDTGVKILPVAILGSAQANRPGHRLPRFRAKITVIIGQPMEFKPPWLFGRVKMARAMQQEVQTRQLMQRIAQLGGLKYVDKPPAQVKAEIAAEIAAKEAAG